MSTSYQQDRLIVRDLFPILFQAEITTYEKIVEIAKSQRRNILNQLALIVDDEYDRMGLNKKSSSVARFTGISSVIED